MSNIIQFPKDKQESELKYNPLTVQPPKSGGVKTLKELNKLLKKERVEDLLGVMPNEHGVYEIARHKKITPKAVDTPNPYLRVASSDRIYARYEFFGASARKWYGDRLFEMKYDRLMGWKTDCEIRINNGDIVYVGYAKEFPSIQGWLRSVLDPSIRNNFDEMWVPKTFKFLIGKATFDYETVEFVGANLEDALKSYCEENPDVKIGFDNLGYKWGDTPKVKENQTFVCAPEPEEGETKAG